MSNQTMYLQENEMQMTPFEEMPRWNDYRVKGFVLTFFLYFLQPLWNIYHGISMNPENLTRMLQFLLELARSILLPMFYAYIWRPITPVPKIIVTATLPEPVVVNSNDELDGIDKSILHTLSRNPSGCTAHMIHQRIGPMYPELEKEDIVKRINILTGLNRASILTTSLSSQVWVPIKVKAH
jgi:hypothetical protein